MEVAVICLSISTVAMGLSLAVLVPVMLSRLLAHEGSIAAVNLRVDGVAEGVDKLDQVVEAVVEANRRKQS